MASRRRRTGGEAAKFSLVNAGATVVAVVLFNLAVHGVPRLATPGPANHLPVLAWLGANLVGMALSFWGSRRWAFVHRRPSGPAGGALHYTLVNVASFAIPMTCLWLSRNVLGEDSWVADNLSSNVVGALLGMAFRFWAFRRFVFKRRRAHSADPDPEPDPDSEPAGLSGR
ncbi:hypothetical protein GCM10027596_10090 [Nocardioides korecus]